MQEVFEKIIKKLEEESDYEPIDYDYGDVACSGEQYFIATDKAIEIVKQAAAEANDCKKPKTNADVIRSMSDEELAEFLREYFTCEYECAAAKAGCQRDCDGTIMEWLQSEVEE